VVVKQA